MCEKKKKLLVLAIPLIVFTSVYGQPSTQSLISSVGESFKNAVYQLDWSIGELSTETYSTSQNILNQGFHHGKYIVTALEQLKNVRCEISVFPNPTTDFITVKFDKNNYQSINYSLVDVSGKAIQTNFLYDNQLQISLCELVAGNYFLNIISDGKILKAFKIIKSN